MESAQGKTKNMLRIRQSTTARLHNYCPTNSKLSISFIRGRAANLENQHRSVGGEYLIQERQVGGGIGEHKPEQGLSRRNCL